MVAHREQKSLAKRLIEESCRKQQIKPLQLTVQADRGSSMKSKVVAELLADLKVTKTTAGPTSAMTTPIRRPSSRRSNTARSSAAIWLYQRIAGAFYQDFSWYNKEHRRSGIAMLTPEQVHYGRVEEITGHRAAVPAAPFEKYPNRFKNKLPVPETLPKEVWINQPPTKNIGV